MVSGTLAYALGAGKAIISTPYWHAIELLDDRRGVLVPFQNPDAIAQKTIELLDTPAMRHAMRKRAYLFSRDMVWKKAAQGYMESFSRVRGDRMENPRVQFSARATPKGTQPTAGVEAGPSERADRRHGNPAARDLYHPQSSGGIHDRRQCARADFHRAARAVGQTSPSGKSDFRFRSAFRPVFVVPGACFRFRKGTIQKFSRLRPSVARSRRLGRLLTDGHCGHLGRYWGAPPTRD